jgi:hypothetical protein
MTRAFFSLLLLLSLCACSDRSSLAAPYKNPWDRVAIKLGYAFWVYQPCFRKEHTPYGDTQGFIGSEKCYRFNRPERMRGVWLNEGEDAEFLPDATVSPLVRTYSPDATSLEFRPENFLTGGHQAYTIEFVGRRATYPGHYGHMGMSRHLIIVDEVLSAKPVPPPERSSREVTE